MDLVQPPLQFDAVGAAHFDVHQREVEGLLRHARQRLVCVLGSRDFVAFLSEPFGQRIPHAELVVNN